MKNVKEVLSFAVIGALIGGLIAEFFPKLLSSGLFGDIGADISEPFSQFRNELALKYGGIGAIAGAAAGFVKQLLIKK
ncbi:MAG: hypothetical protein CVV21_08740 [Candidatus Goldiibacteriota bacterium HGW-Goldbacteria-1]|jgi:uncharacterized protein YqgC (DUF456 family)|nr:MAG: hypothetical protein CVV21_08740 [Candidatus Goldiibacteriota bacterium HGW-Goldbacteria-1]